MSDKPLDLDAIEMEPILRASNEKKLIAECRASRIEINRLTAKAEADAFEIGRLVEENAKLREYVDHWASEPQYHEYNASRLHDDACDEWERKGRKLRAAIGRTEDGQWETP